MIELSVFKIVCIHILGTVCILMQSSPESIGIGKSLGLMPPETWNKEQFCAEAPSLPNVALLLLN